MSQTVLLSSLPIDLPGLPAGATFAAGFTCTQRDSGGVVTPIDLDTAESITFGIWQSNSPAASTPPLAFAEVGSGIVVSGVDNNHAGVTLQTTGMKPGSYFYQLTVTMSATSIIVPAKGKFILI